MGKVTGIGGVFFKSSNNQSELVEWYKKNLGMPVADWGGAVLKWTDDTAEDEGRTVWHTAEKESTWFSPSTSSFMINYRVDNLDEVIAQLNENGATIVNGPEDHENGRFLWVLDPDGNKVELWEPMLWDDKNKKPK